MRYSEDELRTIQQLIDDLQQGKSDPEEIEWIRRCMMLMREVRRLKDELSRELSESAQLEGSFHDTVMM